MFRENGIAYILEFLDALKASPFRFGTHPLLTE